MLKSDWRKVSQIELPSMTPSNRLQNPKVGCERVGILIYVYTTSICMVYGPYTQSYFETTFYESYSSFLRVTYVL